MLPTTDYLAAIPQVSFPVCGRLTRSVGLLLESTGPDLPAGALVKVSDRRSEVVCEVVGFRDERLLMLAIEETRQLAPESLVAPLHLTFKAGPWVLGRVLDGLGRPLDRKPVPSTGERIELEPSALDPMARGLTDTQLDVGVRAINGLMTLGVGQKIGVFAMPGVGKSMLLGMMARGTSADVNVIALIGERGREAREFVQDILGPEGLARSVLIVVASDMPAPMRIKGAFLATAIASYLRGQGRSVLLLMDSLTRVAMAQREVGLASGEPPTARGYPPSVFAVIPKLVEQAGVSANGGSITGIYTVLLHEENDPIGELAKSVLDGHITLSRELAGRGHYPAIDVLNSISRVAQRVCSAEHSAARRRFTELYARWRDAEELIALGTYHPGADRRTDEAVAYHERLEVFLKQDATEQVPLTESVRHLMETIFLMNRKFLHDLIRLREARLREQTAQLKHEARGLTEIRKQHDQARHSAARSIETAETLAQLEVLGHSRIKFAKLAVKAEEQVRGMVDKVGHARKLADAAREAGAELQRAHACEVERSMETEAEQFFSWSKVFGR